MPQAALVANNRSHKHNGLSKLMASVEVRAQAEEISRVGQNRIYTPYMTVYLVISLPKLPYMHGICMYGSGQPYKYVTGRYVIVLFVLGCQVLSHNTRVCISLYL